MSTKYKFKNPQGLYFVTLTVRHWMDVFTRREYKDIIVENLDFCMQNKGLEIFAWCIMTNHLHLIIRAKEGVLLQNILRDFKKHTSKAILNAICENPQESRKEWFLRGFKTNDGNTFWQEGNHPIELFTNEVINEKLDYIHTNPVKAGFVFREQDFLYSSAVDYAGEKGLIKIEFIE
jgi:REP element-mobilizing transposase RayT